MPAALNYQNPQQRKAGVIDAHMIVNDAQRGRIDMIERNVRYYNGIYKKYLEIDDTGVDDNISINMIRQVVDRTVSFVFPEMPRIYTNEEAEETEEEKYIRETLRANKDILFFSELAYNGALAGHAFCRIMKPDTQLTETAKPYPVLASIDPRHIQVFWDVRNRQRVLWYELSYKIEEDAYIEDIVYNPEASRWDLFTYKYNGAAWSLVDSDTWDSVLSPIVDWQHLINPNNYYGISEVSYDVEQLNDNLNRTASDISRILRHHAFPKTILIGGNAESVESSAIDGLWSIENENASVNNLEMESDLQSSMNFLTYLNDSVLAEARVVILRGTVKDFQRVTNTGIRAVFLDMLSKVTQARESYGKAIEKICRRILMLGGFEEMIDINVVWPDPLPKDDTEIVNALAIEKNLGIVSRETLSRKRGYIWTDERERQLQEAKDFAVTEPAPKAGAFNEGGSRLAAQDDTPSN